MARAKAQKHYMTDDEWQETRALRNVAWSRIASALLDIVQFGWVRHAAEASDILSMIAAVDIRDGAVQGLLGELEELSSKVLREHQKAHEGDQHCAECGALLGETGLWLGTKQYWVCAGCLEKRPVPADRVGPIRVGLWPDRAGGPRKEAGR